MKRIIVLGAGRVGRLIAVDLASGGSFDVTVADRSAERLKTLRERDGLNTVNELLQVSETVYRIVHGFDLVVGALPGALGLQTMKAVVAARKPYVDISFMPEDPRLLDADAREGGVPVLYDFGVAPGLSNLLIAHSVHQLDHAREVRCLVGGLPAQRIPPWEYEAPFSPADVIEEYVRPARYKAGGQIQVRPALSDVETIDVQGVGTLEAFLTDGLRSLLDTIPCPNMVEKTLRYPGHAEKIRLLKDSGFLDDREVEIDGTAVNVRDFSFALLDRVWRQHDDSTGFTVMRIEVEGEKEGEARKWAWNLLDRKDPVTGDTSMARTTGYPAAIAARELVNQTFELPPGVHPPEKLGTNERFVKHLLSALADRGVIMLQEAL